MKSEQDNFGGSDKEVRPVLFSQSNPSPCIPLDISKYRGSGFSPNAESMEHMKQMSKCISEGLKRLYVQERLLQCSQNPEIASQMANPFGMAVVLDQITKEHEEITKRTWAAGFIQSFWRKRKQQSIEDAKEGDLTSKSAHLFPKIRLLPRRF